MGNIILSNRSVLSNLIILNFPSVLNFLIIPNFPSILNFPIIPNFPSILNIIQYYFPSVSDRWFNIHYSIAKRCALRALNMRVQ